MLTGDAQTNRDNADAVTSWLPLVLGLICAVTFVLLFLLCGSLVIPLKALLLTVVSLTAAFGAIVWLFQQGHLGGLGTTATGTSSAAMPVLLFCIAFGISMDYEPPDPLVTPRRRENMVGLPADADYPLVCEPVYEPGVGASTWKGHALLLRARRSEFRFPRPMPPGSPPLESVGSVGGQTN
jgi:uncharacterized membrane protein YdfJ with MMPL/SSD domain